MGDFADRVFAVVQRIPAGKVASYGQIARLIGAPRSARYVGYALRANPAPGVDPDSIPCHRVVFKDGRMATGFAFGGEDVQRSMLQEEGVSFDEEGRAVMAECQWDGRPRMSADADDQPTAPPPDFDWERELADHPFSHDCATCTRDCVKKTHD